MAGGLRARSHREDRQSGATLGSVLEINPEAAAIAAALDDERRASGPRGPLHGIPIAHTQDTAGPMARSVRDAAILLTAMATSDENDPAAADHPGPRDYSASLDAESLAGARIGIWRGYPGASRSPRVAALFDGVVRELEAAGATVVEPIEIAAPEGADDAEYEVLLYEFKADLERYLQAGSVDPSRDTLAELIEVSARVTKDPGGEGE